jgi:hypothetical protein
MIIVFDSETRQFSAFDETREFGKVGNFASKYRTQLSTAGGAIVGGAAGGAIARGKAKKKAAELGLEPGTPEYKKFMRAQTAKGAAIGTGAGAATGYGVERGTHILQRRKAVKGTEGWDKLTKEQKKARFAVARMEDKNRLGGRYRNSGSATARAAAAKYGDKYTKAREAAGYGPTPAKK